MTAGARYLISTLSTATSPNMDQNRLNSVRDNLHTHCTIDSLHYRSTLVLHDHHSAITPSLSVSLSFKSTDYLHTSSYTSYSVKKVLITRVADNSVSRKRSKVKETD